MAQQVDAYAGEQIGALRARLHPDRPANLALELDIPGRATGNRHGEARRVSHHHATRTVREADARDRHAGYRSRHHRFHVVSLRHLP